MSQNDKSVDQLAEEHKPEVFEASFGIADGAEDNPCESLHYMVGYMTSGSFVHVEFCQPISWWNMPPEAALKLADSLTRCAHICLSEQKKAAGTTQ